MKKCQKQRTSIVCQQVLEGSYEHNLKVEKSTYHIHILIIKSVARIFFGKRLFTVSIFAWLPQSV